MDEIGRIAESIVQRMTPREMGLMIYPGARPVDFKDVPSAVIKDHRQRYSRVELKAGQFFEVLPGKYTFFMDQAAHDRRHAG